MTLSMNTPSPERSSARPRPRACASCHKRKVRCDMQANHTACSNCRALNYHCVPHRRKRKHELVDTTAEIASTSQYEQKTSPSSQDAFASPTKLDQPRPASIISRPTPNGDQYIQSATTQATSPTQSFSSPSESYLGRADYISGVLPINEEDAKRYPGSSEVAPDEDIAYLNSIDAFSLPSRPVYDGLVNAFLTHCHPWMPIIDPSLLSKPNPSFLLLHAIYTAASRVSTAPLASESGKAFYRKAKALFYCRHEKNMLVTTIALCVIQWWNPSGPEHVSTDSSSFWLRMAVGLAHQIGLHREPDARLPSRNLRRRLWWTLVVRDSLISTSHGRPRAINLRDSDVRPLLRSDFSSTETDGPLFIAYVSICSILGDLTEHCVRGDLSRSDQLSIECRLSEWIRTLPEPLHLHYRQSNGLSPYNFKVRQLHIPYFTALTILYRQTSSAAGPSAVTLLSSSFVAGIFAEFLARGEVPYLASTFIFYLLAAAIAQLTCQPYPSLQTLADADLSTINLALDEMAKRFPSAIGSQRVLRNLTEAGRKQSPHADHPQLSLSPEQHAFFDPFGPELCSRWDDVFEAVGRTDGSTAEAANDWHGVDFEALEQAGSFILQGDANLRGAGYTAPDSFLDGTSFQTAGQVTDMESIGNWMFSDWMSDWTSIQ